MPSPDIAVLGAGPGGCAAAILLARRGARVALIGAPLAVDRIEGASPRVVQVLADLGIPAEGVSPAVRRRVNWGGLTGAPNAEHLVERRRFDASLIAAARAEGVRVIEAKILRVTSDSVETSAGPVRAGIVAEARGRRAPGAPGRCRGPATVAIAGWTDGPARDGDAALGATPSGWFWSAAWQGRRWTQIVVDAASTSAGRAGVARAWEAFAAAAGPGFPALPADPQVRAAELRLTAPGLEPRRPRFGDAAVAMDPLSGHGLFWALSSALMAPPLLGAIADGEAGLAARFYGDRVAGTFWRQARIGRDFHRMVEDWADAPFWAARRAWPDDEPAHPRRAAPGRARGVIVRDGRLREADVLLTPQEPEGVAFVCGQAIAPILDRTGPGPLPRREVFARLLPEIPAATASRIHDWLVSRGVAAAPPREQAPLQGQDENLEVLT